MTASTQRVAVADMIRELTTDHRHQEHYYPTLGQPAHTHHVDVPALLIQLDESNEQSATAEGGQRPGYSSRPAARLDAIDCAVRIDIAAARWVRDLGEDDTRDTIGTLTQLHGLMPSADTCGRPGARREHGKVVCCTLHAIERDIRTWWVSARVVTGWDSAPWKPNNTCPLCGVRDRLLVKLADKIGTCLECGETWDETNIGLLADHIRDESEVERIPTRGTNGWPCACRHCRHEREENINAMVLCPECGRGGCLKATDHRFSCTSAMTDQAG